MDIVLPPSVSNEAFLAWVGDRIDRVHYGISRNGSDNAVAGVVECDGACAGDGGRVVLGENTKAPEVEFFGGEGSRAERNDQVEDERGSQTAEVAVERERHAVRAAGRVFGFIYKLHNLSQGGEGREGGPGDLFVVG